MRCTASPEGEGLSLENEALPARLSEALLELRARGLLKGAECSSLGSEGAAQMSEGARTRMGGGARVGSAALIIPVRQARARKGGLGSGVDETFLKTPPQKRCPHAPSDPTTPRCSSPHPSVLS